MFSPLTLSLGMIHSRKEQFNSQFIPWNTPKWTKKLSVSVTHNGFSHAMQSHNFSKEQFSNMRCIIYLSTCNEMCHFRKNNQQQWIHVDACFFLKMTTRVWKQKERNFLFQDGSDLSQLNHTLPKDFLITKNWRLTKGCEEQRRIRRTRRIQSI